MTRVSKIASLLCVWLFVGCALQAAPLCPNGQCQAPAMQYRLVPAQAPPVIVLQAAPTFQMQTTRTRTLAAPLPGWEYVRGPLGGLWLRPMSQQVVGNYGTHFRLQSSCPGGNCPK